MDDKTLFDTLMDAVYTEERCMWLDPTDAKDIVADVVARLRADTALRDYWNTGPGSEKPVRPDAVDKSTEMR